MKYNKIVIGFIAIIFLLVGLCLMADNSLAYVTSNNSVSGYAYFAEGVNYNTVYTHDNAGANWLGAQPLIGIRIYDQQNIGSICYLDAATDIGHNADVTSGFSPLLIMKDRIGQKIVGYCKLTWSGNTLQMQVYNYSDYFSGTRYIDFYLTDNVTQFYASSYYSSSQWFGNVMIQDMKNNDLTWGSGQVLFTIAYNTPSNFGAMGTYHLTYATANKFNIQWVDDSALSSDDYGVPRHSTMFYVNKTNPNTFAQQPARVRLYYKNAGTWSLLYDDTGAGANSTTNYFFENRNLYTTDVNSYILSIADGLAPYNIDNESIIINYNGQFLAYMTHGYVSNNEWPVVLFSGATINMYNPSGVLINTTITVADGKYDLAIPQSSMSTYGTYTLQAVYSGYYSKNMTFRYYGGTGDDFENTVQGKYVFIYFYLDKNVEGNAPIAFSIFNEENAPLPSVNITVWDVDDITYITGVFTDINGRAAIYLPIGNYHISCKHVGYLSYRFLVPVPDSTPQTITFNMMPESSAVFPTPTPAPNLSPIPTATVAPTVTPAPTGYGNNPAQTIAGGINQTLWDLGFQTDTVTAGYVLGLLVIVFCVALVITVTTGKNGVGAEYTLPAAAVMALAGLIFVCIYGLWPIWILGIVAIVCAILGVLYFLGRGGG